MFYPEEYKEKVKKVFPNRQDVVQKLDNGDETIGRLLDSTACQGISTHEIVAAFAGNDPKTLKALQMKAISLVTMEALYEEWLHMYGEQQMQRFHK